MKSLVLSVLVWCCFGVAQAQAQSPVAAQWSPEVIEANLAAAIENPAARNAFLTSFLNGKIWVRVEQSTYDAAAARERAGTLEALPMQLFASDINGKSVIFGFTRQELAPAAFGQQVPLLGMTGEQVLRLQNQAGFVLNYNNGPVVIFTPEEIAILLQSIQRAPVTPLPASSPH
ncbi:SseB family protein [Brevundimonas sp. Root1279]|uniref:SseB family protein n=1 Tax=Brevundimonas sp. Root1279 TaxID=1736443 RepID=UPI0006FA07BD|nr:SseB family protein [Brevundimonas sp. Root1279]KQW86346.1 hypothetical protein ASC65_00075 [Brevundimonas sp. Root1279]